MTFDPELAANLVRIIPMAERAGLQVVAMGRGHGKVRMPLDGNGSHLGTMYAGGMWVAAEFVGGVLAVGTFDFSRHVPIVTGFDIRFVAPATGDVTVEVRMDDDEIERITRETDEHGKTRFALDAEVRLDDGTVVATTHGQYQLRSIDRIGAR